MTAFAKTFNEIIDDKKERTSEILQDKITLDKVGESVWIADDYEIKIPTNFDFLLVSASVEVGYSAQNFNHPNILQKKRHIVATKAYWPSGRKKWFERPGFSFLFAIPKKNIILIPEKGYSYVKVEIGGKKYNLNVSGGGGNVWTDCVSHGCHVGIFRSQKNLKTLADNAIVDASIELPEFKKMDEREQEYFDTLCAYHITKKQLKTGNVIILKSSCSVDGSHGPFEIKRKPKRKQHYYCYSGYFQFKAYYKHIDWVKTAEENGIKYKI